MEPTKIVIETCRSKAVADHSTEIVERKGLGHPDSICDAVMEAISIALSEAYLKEFDAILHYNVDKGLLAAGRVRQHFGGGKVLQPMELMIGDRATFEFRGKKIPVAEIAIETARRWFDENLRFVESRKHLDCRVVLAPGSEELAGIFARKGKVPAANDTSAAVGFYPLTPTESAVLELERFLNSSEFKTRFPETGEDVKIMGVRRGRGLELTVAMPLLTSFLSSEKDYFERKEAVLREMEAMTERLSGFNRRRVYYNTLDLRGRGLSGTYTSLLGTSAEDADSGQVGRGNRVNGLISLNRPMGTEAAAGKNPVSHVGKIYNVLAHRLARDIHNRVEGLAEVYVYILGRIGAPVDRPALVSVQLLPVGDSVADVEKAIEDLIEEELAGMEAFCRELAVGKYPVC